MAAEEEGSSGGDGVIDAPRRGSMPAIQLLVNTFGSMVLALRSTPPRANPQALRLPTPTSRQGLGAHVLHQAAPRAAARGGVPRARAIGVDVRARPLGSRCMGTCSSTAAAPFAAGCRTANPDMVFAEPGRLVVARHGKLADERLILSPCDAALGPRAVAYDAVADRGEDCRRLKSPATTATGRPPAASTSTPLRGTRALFLRSAHASRAGGAAVPDERRMPRTPRSRGSRGLPRAGRAAAN